MVADPGQLTTALINLLLNARDASDNRGRVELRVHVPSEERVAIEVRDFGEGMTEDQVQRAIEPFYSTKISTLASGLGLSMVYGFVRQSGGDLDIESRVGVGTTVRLTLPAADPAQALVAQPAQIEQLPEGLSFLVVDDNADVREMMRMMLVSMNQRVRVAVSGQAGLDLLNHEAPDVLISDVLMPGTLNGLEFAEAAKAVVPQLPILMVSGYAEAVDLDFPLLPKPFTKRELEQRLLHILNQPTASSAARTSRRSA